MHKILGILVFYTVQAGSYQHIGPILKGHAIQKEMELIVCPETMVPNYQSMLHKIPEE
jgi:hypothetical protein